MPNASLIKAAYTRISPYVRRTPTITVESKVFNTPSPLALKLECLQHTGSFKPRGAFNKMLATTVPATGVLAASGGNHGIAVAFAARKLGHPAEIFVPTISSPVKVERLRSYGATVNVVGNDYAETLETSSTRATETDAVVIHAYNQAEVIAGQGTVGLELEQQAPHLDTLLVSVGGGGLIGGIAAWFAGRVRVIAVEPIDAPSLNRALEKGTPVDVQVSGVAADSLGARRVGTIMFEIAQKYVDQSLLVSDDAIRGAQKRLWEELRVVCEPGGATALAALTSGVYKPQRKERVGVLLCGANTDPSTVI